MQCYFSSIVYAHTSLMHHWSSRLSSKQRRETEVMPKWHRVESEIIIIYLVFCLLEIHFVVDCLELLLVAKGGEACQKLLESHEEMATDIQIAMIQGYYSTQWYIHQKHTLLSVSANFVYFSNQLLKKEGKIKLYFRPFGNLC